MTSLSVVIDVNLIRASLLIVHTNEKILKFNIHANMNLHVHEVYVLTSYLFCVPLRVPHFSSFEAMEMLDALPHAAFIMAEVGRALVNLSPLTEGLGKTYWFPLRPALKPSISGGGWYLVGKVEGGR